MPPSQAPCTKATALEPPCLLVLPCQLYSCLPGLHCAGCKLAMGSCKGACHRFALPHNLAAALAIPADEGQSCLQTASCSPSINATWTSGQACTRWPCSQVSMQAAGRGTDAVYAVLLPHDGTHCSMATQKLPREPAILKLSLKARQSTTESSVLHVGACLLLCTCTH